MHHSLLLQNTAQSDILNIVLCIQFIFYSCHLSFKCQIHIKAEVFHSFSQAWPIVGPLLSVWISANQIRIFHTFLLDGKDQHRCAGSSANVFDVVGCNSYIAQLNYKTNKTHLLDKHIFMLIINHRANSKLVNKVISKSVLPHLFPLV